jgi:FMN phosphatase YigB (HAD superfamily)
MYDGLLLDIGDVIVNSPWEAFDQFEAITGRRVAGRGPYGPEDDPFWQARLAGELTYVGYWDSLAKAADFEDWRQMFRVVTDTVPHGLFDDDALGLMRDARAEGRRVGVLTNDGYLINGPEWFQRRPEFQDLDAFVDATELGVRKPAAEAYLAAAKELDVLPERIVFLDDTPECVEGARAVGMVGIHVDPQARQPAFDRARELLGLVPPSRAARLVQAAEDAYASLDLDAVLRLFHPDCVVWWNGRKAASGLEEIRRFHTERLGFGGAGPANFQLTKTLRAAEGDTICVEWVSSHRRTDGSTAVGRAGEFWTMRGDLVIEWHAYHHRVDDRDRG